MTARTIQAAIAGVTFAILGTVAPAAQVFRPIPRLNEKVEFPRDGTRVNLTELNKNLGRNYGPDWTVMAAAVGNVCARVDGKWVSVTNRSFFFNGYFGPINFAVANDGTPGGNWIFAAPASQSTLLSRLATLVHQRADRETELKLPATTSASGRNVGLAKTGAGGLQLWATGLEHTFHITDGPNGPEVTLRTAEEVAGAQPRVAHGDVFGQDGRDDAVVSSSKSSWIEFYETVHGTPLKIAAGSVFQNTLEGGVWPALFDWNGDLVLDLAVGAGSGEKRVRIFNGSTGFQDVLADFLVVLPRNLANVTDGVRVAGTIVDGRPGLIVASGAYIDLYLPTPDGTWVPLVNFGHAPFGNVVPGGVSVGALPNQ